ncbi:MAG: hypothetical protein II515_02455 [Desulfovibrio sp.]|nr:hypothetical protein [Desulfovibrio sp.]
MRKISSPQAGRFFSCFRGPSWTAISASSFICGDWRPPAPAFVRLSSSTRSALRQASSLFMTKSAHTEA